ncbi:MAG: CapA family protein [Oscillospiraceae bacterium]|nr:CapA family protein [Oscillospiraceae bacterium]
MKTNKIADGRSCYWDNIKGILIFLVVFAHFLYSFQHFENTALLTDIIYTFHMPAFVFVSGYFSKSDNSRSPLSLFRLAAAYILFNGGCMLFSLPDGIFSGSVPYYSYWYLLALIIWRVTVPYISKIGHILPILILFSLLTGFWGDIDNSFAAARIICFYPYFMAGYFMDKDKVNAILSAKKSKRLVLGLSSLALFITGSYLAVRFFRYSDDALLMAAYTDRNGLFGRIALIAVACLGIAALLILTADKQIPLLTQIGRNSLSVYLCHRGITLLYADTFPELPENLMISSALICTAAIMIVFGSETVSSVINSFLTVCAKAFLPDNKKKRIIAAGVTLAVYILTLNFFPAKKILSIAPIIPLTDTAAAEKQNEDIMYRKMSAETAEKYDNAFRILFAGDLILLEDQVRNARNSSGYDFSPMFEYTKEYISSADLAVGVFEGPMAGDENGYSSSNYDDGKNLYLNFPDEFAYAIKDAGFDLVTTANNHLLDMGKDGAYRTLDILDESGLDHTGSYRSPEEKAADRVKLIEKDGIKIAFLSYTYGTNGYETEYIMNTEGFSHITSFITDPASECFEQAKENVRLDFEAAKALSPDIIAVLPHMGTQFENTPDDYQKTWCDIFREYGADIILSDHTHSVQPAEITDNGDNTVYTLYCPGNYTNIYREYNGDASLLAEVYIDRESKEIIGGGIIPMYTLSTVNGNYRPIPVYDIMTNDRVRDIISTDDLKRAEEVYAHITKIMFGYEIFPSSAEKRLLFDTEGYFRQAVSPVTVTDEMKNGIFYKMLTEAKGVCFVGDSVTEGTKNGGYGWYEPLEEYINGGIYNVSKGSTTIGLISERSDEMINNDADLYVIAVGTNDVRYRDESICAMTAEDYSQAVDKLCCTVAAAKPQAEFILIAPWTSVDGDSVSALGYDQKIALNNEYTAALEKLCSEKGYIFINANTYIESIIGQKAGRYPISDYLLDHIHPNVHKGIYLYSEAVLKYGLDKS